MELLNIRELLRQGDTGKALAELIAVLQQDVRYRDNLLRTLRVLESEYNAVRQKELKGILPFQEAQREYNATNDALLAILDDVEAGRVPGSSALGGGRRNLILAVFGGAMLVLAAFTLWRAFGKKDAGCPEFSKEQALHVLVLPFDNLGTKAQSVEAIIQRDISNLTQKAKIPVEVILATRQTDDPPSLQIAESRGRTCKADLVIYGMYKAFDPGDSLAVNLGFKYLKAGAETGSVPFKTFRDITEFDTERDLKDALFSVCAMIALMDKNWEFAGRWMDKIKNKEPEELKMAQWLDEKKTAPAN